MTKRNDMIEFLAKTAQINTAEAETVLDFYVSEKIVKIDRINGHYDVVHGGFYEKDTILNVLNHVTNSLSVA